MTKQKIKCEVEGCDHVFDFTHITIRHYLDYVNHSSVLEHLKIKHPSLYKEIQTLRLERKKYDDIVTDINWKLHELTRKAYSPNI